MSVSRDGGANGRILALDGCLPRQRFVHGGVGLLDRGSVRRAHCALCDITHGIFREKAEFARCRDGLDVPFVAVHLDERGPELLAVTEGRTPCVVATVEDSNGSTRQMVLLDPADLEECHGKPAAFVAAVSSAAAGAGLSWS